MYQACTASSQPFCVCGFYGARYAVAATEDANNHRRVYDTLRCHAGNADDAEPPPAMWKFAVGWMIDFSGKLGDGTYHGDLT